jgi:heme exporter protein C
MLFKYANPTQFLKVSDRLSPWLLGGTIVCLCVGLYGGLFLSPPDYQQKDSVRIMYLHVPSAWMALFIYGFMGICSFCRLVWKHALADVLAQQAAAIGAVFTFICLITGALWGKPTWGAWWVWDARLTSMLILLFLYFGYLGVWSLVKDYHRAAPIAAFICLIGCLDLPIIHYSVVWWNTLHQGASVFRVDGSSIHITMLWPLMVMACGFHLLFFSLLLYRTRTGLLERRYQTQLSHYLQSE